MVKKDKLKELACDLENEDDCEEEEDEEGLSEDEVEEAETKHYGEKDDKRSGEQ